MDKCLKPDRFKTNPTSPDSKKKWQHWIKNLRAILTLSRELLRRTS